MGNTGNFSVLQEGSTLIKDHKTAVDALNDVLAATTTDEAKKRALDALHKIGEPITPGNATPPLQTQMVDPVEAQHVETKLHKR